MIGAWSARFVSRASENSATCLASNGSSPKVVPSEVRPGDTTLRQPTSATMTWPTVPIPERFGPSSRKAFCWLVSLVTK